MEMDASGSWLRDHLKPYSPTALRDTRPGTKWIHTTSPISILAFLMVCTINLLIGPDAEIPVRGAASFLL